MTETYGLTFKTHRTVTNSKGETFYVYEAGPTFDFWKAWKEDKKAMFDKGYSCNKDQQGKWKAQLWCALAPGSNRTTPATSQAKLSAASYQ